MAAPAVPPKVGIALEVWFDSSHEFYHPTPDRQVPEPRDIDATKLVGRDWDGDNAKSLIASLKVKQSKVPQFRFARSMPI